MLLKWKKKERRKSCNPNLFFLPIFEHICKFSSILVFIFSMDILMASFFPLSLYQHLYSSREKNWLSCKVLWFLFFVFFFLNKANLFPTDKISCMFFLCVCATTGMLYSRRAPHKALACARLKQLCTYRLRTAWAYQRNTTTSHGLISAKG